MQESIILWHRRVVDLLTQGMTLDQIELVFERERQEEMTKLERELRRRMWMDIYLPAGVGLLSVVWLVIMIEYSSWVALLSMPAMAWCQLRLSKFW